MKNRGNNTGKKKSKRIKAIVKAILVAKNYEQITKTGEAVPTIRKS